MMRSISQDSYEGIFLNDIDFRFEPLCIKSKNSIKIIHDILRFSVVHAHMGQKLLKPYILRVFLLTDYKLFQATFD
jgi:hypothetical protein